MRSPLVVVALLYAGGVVLGNYLPARLSVLFALSFLTSLPGCCLRRSRVAALSLLLGLTGWTNLASRTAVLSPRDLRLMVGEQPVYVTVHGRLLETPVLRIHERGARVMQRCAAQLQVQALLRQGTWQPAFGQVMASTPGLLD